MNLSSLAALPSHALSCGDPHHFTVQYDHHQDGGKMAQPSAVTSRGEFLGRYELRGRCLSVSEVSS